ncbi:MAG TPA: IS1 family transposase [Terriglobia bacterium]|nr:IS1 family transposase [Terriglobia bacterium]
MNRLPFDKQVAVVTALCEGASIRATSRMTGVAKGTITSLLETVGTACAEFHDRTVVRVKARRIQCDETWCFCYAKEKNVPSDKRGQFGYGDVWTWVAIDADTKLNIAYLVAKRDLRSAHIFMQDLAPRLANRVQLTTDGLRVYLVAVEGAFGVDVDYATLHKLYGAPEESEKRYSPAQCIGVKAATVCGRPDFAHISTSFIERQNLTMRMQMRRFTRLTNGFSKKIENLCYAVALYAVHYNFCRVHQTLRVTPAMEAGLATRVWDVADIVRLVEPSGVRAVA